MALSTATIAVVLMVRVTSVEAKSARIGRALEDRLSRQSAFEATAAQLLDRQAAVIARLNQIETEAELQPEAMSCEDSTPTYRYGVGILQVASVPESRGSDTERFAKSQLSRLATLLASRNLPPAWSSSLSHYRGLGKEPVRRVVFNNVGPAAGAEMCAWLRCQKWTGGCLFIDERGEAHADPAPSEYEPTEDLYEAWRVSTL